MGSKRYKDMELKPLLDEEKEYCEEKLKALEKCPEEDYPTEYLSETTQYWKGRIDQLDFILGWVDD